LLVEISGEPYAIPLSQIARTLKLPPNQIQTLQGRRHFQLGDHSIGLLKAHDIFESPDDRQQTADFPVVVLADHNSHYGLIVDRFLGERELVIQPLDARLGKVKDISAAALMEDGSPVLVVDVEDMVRSIEKLIEEPSGSLDSRHSTLVGAERKVKRILAVDDSLTVRELERKLLASHGYLIDLAVDGVDGWNAVRTRRYDLVITDVDMPRMDGIELATLMKKDPRLKSIPVMIVSYKDREEDRQRGLQAGANYYLTKGSFNDETFLQAVKELIGGAS
jgi:two-component system sensor histidine kinase and response regulator WspE